MHFWGLLISFQCERAANRLSQKNVLKLLQEKTCGEERFQLKQELMQLKDECRFMMEHKENFYKQLNQTVEELNKYKLELDQRDQALKDKEQPTDTLKKTDSSQTQDNCKACLDELSTTKEAMSTVKQELAQKDKDLSSVTSKLKTTEQDLKAVHSELEARSKENTDLTKSLKQDLDKESNDKVETINRDQVKNDEMVKNMKPTQTKPTIESQAKEANTSKPTDAGEAGVSAHDLTMTARCQEELKQCQANLSMLEFKSRGMEQLITQLEESSEKVKSKLTSRVEKLKAGELFK